MARGSAYGDMIKMLPGWVMGGEFGDISNLLNKRDQAYEQTENAEITNDRNQIRLEDERRNADFEEELRKRDIFGGNQDALPTLRDMYGRVRDVAMDIGSYEDVMQLQEKLESLNRQAEQDALEKRTKESMILARGRGGGGSNKPTIRLENVRTGEKGIYTPDEANEKLGTGDWDFAKNNFLNDLQRMAQQGPSQPEVLGDSRKEKPGEREIEKQRQLTEDIKQSVGSARISSGEVASRDIKIRDPRTGAITIIRKGEVVP